MLKTTLLKASTHDLVRWLLLLLALLVPVVYSTGFESVFTLPKLTVLRVITLAIVVIWGVQVVAQKEFTYRQSRLNRWIAGYAVALVLVTLFSRYIWVSLLGAQGHFLGLFTLLNLLFLVVAVMNFFQTKGEVRRLIEVSVWTAIALSIFGLLQFKGIVGAENWSQDPTERVFGTLGHSNHFGAYLAFSLILLLGLLLTSKRRWTKALYTVAIIPFIWTILATASRGAFIAVVAAGLFSTALLVIQNWKWVVRKKIELLLSALTVAVAVGIFVNHYPETLQRLGLAERTLETLEFMEEGNVPDRVSWAYSSLEMIKDKPLLGHGVSTYREVYNLYRRTDYRVPGDIQDTITPENAHNEYLTIASTQGLIGLFFFAGLVLSWMRQSARTVRKKSVPKSVRLLALSLWSAGWVFLVQVLVSFGVIATLVPFYLVIGAGAALYHISADDVPQRKQFRTIPLKGPKWMVSLAVVAVLFLGSAWMTVKQALADYYLQVATHARAAEDTEDMLEAYKAMVSTISQMHTYWEEYGAGTYDLATKTTTLEEKKHLLEKSIWAYKQALELVQTQPFVYSNLGLATLVYADLLESQGEVTRAKTLRDEAVGYYETAETIAVSNPLYPYTLGTVYLRVGDKESAFEAFERVLPLRDPHRDTYYQLAWIATELKDYDNARLYVQKALTEDPSDADTKALLQRINLESK